MRKPKEVNKHEWFHLSRSERHEVSFNSWKNLPGPNVWTNLLNIEIAKINIIPKLRDWKL